jgi:hypothetical protein
MVPLHSAFRRHGCPACRLARTPKSQRGAVAVMVAAMMFVLLGVCGMAIDLGMMYNRRVDMQNLADAVAMAAAGKLDGTAQGVTRALSGAENVALRYRYQYGLAVTWNDAAIQFATEPDKSGNWVAGEIAQATPNGRLFVRVNTLALDASHSLVRSIFMNVFGQSKDALMQGLAIAGRTGIRVTPLAVCAMAPVAAASRTTGAGNELVEFGFRRGVGYDLMQLNPNGTTPENFVVNPFAPPGKVGSAGPTSPEIVGPYVCAGTMSMARVTGGAITVARPFPLAALVEHLNSRFDKYTGGACARSGAPPDFNIKAYPYTGIPWMTTVPLAQGAAALAENGKLYTVADANPTPLGTTAGKFGPLWSFAKAVPFSAYVPGTAEPAAGYTTFGATSWGALYNPGQPAANNYPASSPYQASAGTYFLAPSTRGLRNRRVLNVPLLSCPVAAGTTVGATVLGVGKFFMTVPATSTSIYAEFGGLVSDQALSSATMLFP